MSKPPIPIDWQPDPALRPVFDQLCAGDAALVSLDLSGQELGDAGALCLAGGLPGNTTLASLRLLQCGIGSAGVLALTTAVDPHSPLELAITTDGLSIEAQQALQAMQQRTAGVRLATAYGASPVSCVRLCICGPALVGKTTLVRRLGGEVHQEVGSRTMGIDLVPLKVGGASFMVWDFAGQAEFYVTHELLLAGPGT